MPVGVINMTRGRGDDLQSFEPDKGSFGSGTATVGTLAGKFFTQDQRDIAVVAEQDVC